MFSNKQQSFLLGNSAPQQAKVAVFEGDDRLLSHPVAILQLEPNQLLEVLIGTAGKASQVVFELEDAVRSQTQQGQPAGDTQQRQQNSTVVRVPAGSKLIINGGNQRNNFYLQNKRSPSDIPTVYRTQTLITDFK